MSNLQITQVELTQWKIIKLASEHRMTSGTQRDT